MDQKVVETLTLLQHEPDFVGVAAGSLASARVLSRGNIHALWLRCLTGAGVELTRAQILADLSDIEVKIDGVPFISVDATFLLDRQKYYGDSIGAGNDDGMIPIFFTYPHLPTFAQRAVTALGTNDVSSITITAKCSNPLAQLSRIELYTEVDDLPIRNVGQHIRIHKFTRNFASTGLQDISDLPYEDQNVIGYIAMHLTLGTAPAAIDKLTLKRNRRVVFEDLSVKQNAGVLKRTGRTPQTGYFHLDFAKQNDLASFLSVTGVTSLLVSPTWDAAGAPGNFNVYTERLFSTKSN